MRAFPSLIVLVFALSVPALAEETAPAPASETAKQVPTVNELLERVTDLMDKTQDYTGIFIREERKDGRFIKQVNRFKFKKPFQVYLAFVKPHAGREVIFRRGWNDNEIKVHKGSFPDVTVNLDPRGNMAMKDNHHPVLEFGIANVARLCKRNLDRLRKRGEGEIRVEDGGEMLGHRVWKVITVFPKGGVNTIVREDETLWDVARRTGQDMYWILYSNRSKGWDEADDPDEGDRVFVPRYYGAKAELYLDKQTGLPVRMIVWDRAGRIYERYTYKDLKLNVGLTARDFDPDNPKYDF